MSEDVDRRLRDAFAAVTRDVTPAPVRGAARVLFAPVSGHAAFSAQCALVLSASERQRAGRFRAPLERARFEQRRAFRRFCAARVLQSSEPLSQIAFEETEKGRPYLPELPDVSFSFSSCRLGLLGAWSSGRAVGVDLEDHARDIEALELARQYFSPAETDAVEAEHGERRRLLFYRLWSLKEAALKSIGEGLPFGLDAFELELAPVPRVVRTPVGHGVPGCFEAYLLAGTDSRAAVLVTQRTA